MTHSTMTKTKLFMLLPSLALSLGVAWAQTSNGPGYFIPKAPAPPTQNKVIPTQPPPSAPTSAQSALEEAEKLPPIPNLPTLSLESTPPAAVIGTLSVPEILQKSTAMIGIEKVIEGRRAVLAKEAEAEQKKLQAEQKTIEAEQKKLGKQEIASKEKALQQEIEAAQVKFHNKDVAIQIAGRKAVGKVQAMLIAVIRQVARAHGMNLVLHRSQTVLNANGFDISEEVVTRLNKLLPAVAVPPSIVPKGAAAIEPQKP